MSAYSPGTLRSNEPSSVDEFPGVPTKQLATELLRRLKGGGGLSQSYELTWLGTLLQRALRRDLDTHINRFSKQCYQDLFSVLYSWIPSAPELRGLTILEAGCGSVNPFALCFLFLALGADRAYAVDLDEIQDSTLACEALADLAAMLLLDPPSILGTHEITRAQILDNLSRFDLAQLRQGHLEGLDHDRLTFIRTSTSTISVPSGSVDFLYSNAFLEHMSDVERGIAEFARVTRAGGLNVHMIDFYDHQHRVDARHPLDFLGKPSDHVSPDGLNRLRLHEFEQVFASQGFAFVDRKVYQQIPVSDELKATFVSPYSEMTSDQLGILLAATVWRRK